MKKKFISKVLIALLIIGVSPAGASAEWKSNSTGWWYTEVSSYAKGWRQIDHKWYYFDGNGYMKTGWLNDNGKWYFLKASGEMATGTVIDGFVINNDGVWVTGYKYSVDEAKKLMLKEDSEYVDKLLANNNEIIKGEIGIQESLRDNYGIDEEVYGFYFISKDTEAVVDTEFVGVNSGNVYRSGSNGGSGNKVKLIGNNQVIKEYTWSN